MAKIAIIGAGSLTFTARLVADILTFETLRDAHFALVDTDAERLGFAKQIVQRILSEGGYDKASFSASAERRDVLAGCDYVIISILVGGYEAIAPEIDIPMKYGVDQCIGDTLNAGGIMRCMRTLPVLAGIATDVMDLCPDAQVLNYTNPMSMLCGGTVRAVPEVKLVGLCHSVQHTTHQWAERLGEEFDDIQWKCAGINHQAWLYEYRKGDEDLLPRIRQLAVNPEIWLGDTVRMEMVKHFGYPVTESSGHGSEYTPWWRKRPELIEQYCPGGSWNGEHGFIKKLYSRTDWKERMGQLANGEKPIDLGRSMEFGSYILNACEGGDTVTIHGNVPNNGLIDNLPAGSCVEVPVLVDADGLHPQPVGALPQVLAAINRTQISVQELAVEAALQKDPEILFQAMAMDPLTGAVLTLDEIRAMTAELIEAHRFCLPGWEDKSLEIKPVLVGTKADAVEKHVDPGEGR